LEQIGFNKPYLSGKELLYIKEAVLNGKISGDGIFTKSCHQFFQRKYSFRKCLLTTSCTDALEMAAILLDIQEGDEIIAPSYTFVSTVNAFILRGGKIVFCDSQANHPNIDAEKIESLITHRTKVIIPVHYAGVGCDMDKIMALADKYNLYVVEDAAQAIDSYYKGKPLGSIGHLAAFSFHETKNIISGEGGMLVINDEQFIERAEIIREKGTNRTAFFRGEVNKYQWVDIGSSFLPSEITAAFLYAQLEQLEDIQQRRKQIWQQYNEGFASIKDKVKLPQTPDFATNNAHAYYLVCKNLEERTQFIQHCTDAGINAVFHYLSLHKSSYYTSKNSMDRTLPRCDYYADGLVRLPFYYELRQQDLVFIIKIIINFWNK
jgi:dTDP-4-amino-4,6-dideoxygalactose transaminase